MWVHVLRVLQAKIRIDITFTPFKISLSHLCKECKEMPVGCQNKLYCQISMKACSCIYVLGLDLF